MVLCGLIHLITDTHYLHEIGLLNQGIIMDQHKIEAFRQVIEDEMKELRFLIGNVGCHTTRSQRENLIKRIDALNSRLNSEKYTHIKRLTKNEKRLGRRITEEAKERYREREKFYKELLRVTKVYIVKTQHLTLSAHNQFEQYEVEDESSKVRRDTKTVHQDVS